MSGMINKARLVDIFQFSQKIDLYKIVEGINI